MNGIYFIHKEGNVIKITFKNKVMKEDNDKLIAIVMLLNGLPSASIPAVIKAEAYPIITDNVDVEVLDLKHYPLMMLPF